MSYELWDTETRNIIEAFESEDDALQAARELVALNPAVYPDALALVFEDEDGESRLVARGASLATPFQRTRQFDDVKGGFQCLRLVVGRY